MADLLQCKLCGYRTVRCGMYNHIAKKHISDSASFSIEEYTVFLGTVKHWSKNKNQIPAPVSPKQARLKVTKLE